MCRSWVATVLRLAVLVLARVELVPAALAAGVLARVELAPAELASSAREEPFGGSMPV
jgi:hypothetical protein